MKSLLILNLIVPFVMLLVSFLLSRFPVKTMPAKGSHLRNGYNTPASHLSQAHWDFAQKTAPQVFAWFGKAVLTLEILLTLFTFLFNLQWFIFLPIGLFLGFCGILWAFLKTESLIRKNIRSAK